MVDGRGVAHFLFADGAEAVFPGATWNSIVDLRSAGWSPAGLDSVRDSLATLASTGFVAIVGGRILMRYGNLDTVTYPASVRKSVLSLLMGSYVRRGTVDLEKSLAQLGMDGLGGLSPQEKLATVKDLLTARSGIYHPASNAGDDTDQAPPRGSQPHGAYYLYNNWDFDALGGAFELMTGRDIDDILETDLARPIGMQDFERARHRKSGDSTRSRYLAYHMHFSTRDMARIGYLMLRQGQWNGRPPVPADWVEESTRAFTPVEAMNPPARRQGPFGYGYLWWVWDGPHAAGVYRGAYAAHGAIGQQYRGDPGPRPGGVPQDRPGTAGCRGAAAHRFAPPVRPAAGPTGAGALRQSLLRPATGYLASRVAITQEDTVELGSFSVSPAIKDIQASKPLSSFMIADPDGCMILADQHV